MSQNLQDRTEGMADPGRSNANLVYILYLLALVVGITAIIGVVTAWAMTPPLTWILGLRLGWGALGGWIGLCLEVILGAILLWARLQRGSWRLHAAESRANLAVA